MNNAGLSWVHLDDKLHAMLPKYEAGVDFGVPDLYLGFTPKTPLATLKK